VHLVCLYTYYPIYVIIPIGGYRTSAIIKERLEDTGAEMQGAKMPGLLNFVFWCLLSVDPQEGPCLTSPSWRLESAPVPRLFVKLVPPRSEEPDVSQYLVGSKLNGDRLSGFINI
jgi:hypothetical protein